MIAKPVSDQMTAAPVDADPSEQHGKLVRDILASRKTLLERPQREEAPVR